MLSHKFISKIKLNKQPSYQIAHKAGIHPSTLSKLINGIEIIQQDDKRVLEVGKVLGLNPSECFKVKIKNDG